MNSIDEPIITVNGRHLSEAEAMTIRVALNAFIVDMLYDDDPETRLSSLYQKHAHSILEKMQ